MRMIPDAPNRQATFTETKVFSLLSALDWGEGATCISALNLAEHEYKRWGEIDFVVLGSGGPIVIEVKGGQVSCQDGIWRYQSGRNGQPIIRRESPFGQASSAFFALEKYISDHFGRDIAPSSASGFCVIFASMTPDGLEGIVGGPETPAALTGCARDLADTVVLSRFLSRVKTHWAERARHSGTRWDARDVKRVASFLRPSFDRVPPPSLRLRQLREERLQLTEEQYFVLDRMADQSRLLVEGGAGCGKTFLALEAARRAAYAGQRVRFVVGTRELSQHLRASVPLPSAVRIESFEDLSNDATSPADVLIVDEGQQLTNRLRLDALEAVVRGGLEGGSWLWFADANHQVAIDSGFEPAAMDLLRMMSTQQVMLFDNCRNTEETVEYAEQVSGASVGRSRLKGRGPRVAVVKVREQSEIEGALGEALRDLESADGAPHEAVVLCAAEEQQSMATRAAANVRLNSQSWSSLFRALGAQDSHSVAIATIAGFRGLESEYVFIVGLEAVVSDSDLSALLYIALTRATFAATIICTKQLGDRLASLIMRGIATQRT